MWKDIWSLTGQHNDIKAHMGSRSTKTLYGNAKKNYGNVAQKWRRSEQGEKRSEQISFPYPSSPPISPQSI